MYFLGIFIKDRILLFYTSHAGYSQRLLKLDCEQQREDYHCVTLQQRLGNTVSLLDFGLLLPLH